MKNFKSLLIALLLVLTVMVTAKSVQADNEKNESIKIMFTGDILMHDSMMESVEYEDGYKFEELFKYIKDEFKGNDINISNIESTIRLDRPVAGYPCFNAPIEILSTLKKMGVDYLINSHNHILDTGYDGMISTLNHMKEAGLKSLGVSEPDEERRIIYEKGKIKVGISAFTYGVNGRTDYGNYINYLTEENVKKELNRLDKFGCNYKIIYLHIGTEYVREVESYQKKLIDKIMKYGADAVICSHVHVARKSEVKYHGNKVKYINYGMGNFISNQNDTYTDIGSMTKLEIGFMNGQPYLKKGESIPIYRLRYGEKDRIYRTVRISNVSKFKNFIGDEEYKIIQDEYQRIKLTYVYKKDTTKKIQAYK